MKLAIIGDIHAMWRVQDTTYFNASDLDGVLCVGDLPGRNHKRLPEVGAALSKLQLPTLVLPGNHDGPGPLDVLAEGLLGRSPAFRARTILARLDELESQLRPATLTGYKRHTWTTAHESVDIIAARPLAMDGRHLTFRHALQKRYGVFTLQDSVDLLCSLVDASQSPVVFLAHNGPAGFGSSATSPWGLPLFGRDNGDTDLERAITHAQQLGRPVLAVVAGHMHYNDARPRQWRQEREGVLYVNAARVPRIQRAERLAQHHYVELHVSATAATATSRTFGVPRVG